MKKNKLKYIIVIAVILFSLFIFCLLKYNLFNLKANVAEFASENITISISDANLNSDGAVIFPYDSGTKQVTVVADFKDTTSSNKKLEIVLAEGLTYKSYQVLEKQNYLETEFSDGIIKDSIESIERPIYVEDKKYNSNLNSNYTSYGNLIYHIKADKEKIEITFNIDVDMYKFYGPKFIEDAIKVNLYKENKKIDTISTNVDITGNYDIKFKTFDAKTYTKKFFSSSENNISYGKTFVKVPMVPTGFLLPFYKKAVYTLHYFDNTSFDSIMFSNRTGDTTATYEYREGLSADKCINVENFENDKKVIVTIGNDEPNNNCYNYYLTSGIRVKYSIEDYEKFSFNDINDTKIFDIRGKDELSVTYYDGNVVKYVNNISEKLEVFHPLNNTNLLNIDSQVDAYDDYDNESITLGPFFGIINDTPGEKINQTFEFEIDENYQAVGITVPRNKDTKVLKVYYKTNINNEWIEYKNLNTPFANKYRIMKADVNLAEDEFFIGAKITLDKFPEVYQSHAGSPKANYNALVYGNLKSDVSSATVKFKICNDNNNCTESTKTISHPEKLTCSIRHAGISFNDINAKQFIKTINSGEKFLLKGELGLNGYPYGTSTLMRDVKIYLRQPKGLTIDLNNIELYDKNKNKINPVISSVKRENDTLYILETNSTIGYYKDYTSYASTKEDIINISIPYTIDKGCTLSSINTNELIFYGNENYSVSQGFPALIEDVNDMDNNPSTNKITSSSNINLTIQPDKSFLVQTYIIKDNVEYPQYNEYNSDTIIEISKGEKVEYNVKIKNNMADRIDSYSIYIPIPKKKINYGLNYQSNTFEWDFNLLEKLEEKNKFEILYSDDIFNDNFINPTKMTFDSNVEALENVTMIKIVSKESINPSEEYVFSVKLEVSSNISNKENLKLNIWNPVSYVQSNVLTGEVKGSSIATKLYAPSISGLVYLDINKNRTYDKNIDIPGVNDIKLELYKTVEDKDLKITNINIDALSGKFSYIGDKTLKEGTYSIKLVSSLYQVNSDVINDDWIRGLTFAGGEGYYYEIGYITDEFAPVIKAEDAYIYVGDKIEFEKYIKEAYDYKKEKIEFVFDENVTYQSDIPNNNGIAIKSGIFYSSYEVIDKYGNKASSLIKIYVREKPVIPTTTSKYLTILSPSTNDNIIINIVIAICSIVAMIISVILYKKKTNK